MAAGAGAIYPLKINRFRVSNSALTYVDDDPKRPLEFSKVELVGDQHPQRQLTGSHLSVAVRRRRRRYSRGALHVDGHANFLAEPFAGSAPTSS